MSPKSPKSWIGRVEKPERNLTVRRSSSTRSVRERPYLEVPSVRDAGGERGGLAGVAREPDDADAGVAVRERDQPLEAAIGAAVVHRHHLGQAVERVQRRAQLGEQRPQALRLVVDGDDDRERGRRGAQNSVSATNWR